MGKDNFNTLINDAKNDKTAKVILSKIVALGGIASLTKAEQDNELIKPIVELWRANQQRQDTLKLDSLIKLINSKNNIVDIDIVGKDIYLMFANEYKYYEFCGIDNLTLSFIYFNEKASDEVKKKIFSQVFGAK